MEKNFLKKWQTVKIKDLNHKSDNHPYMKVVNFIWATNDDGSLRQDHNGNHMLSAVRTGWFSEDYIWIEKEWHSHLLEPVESHPKALLNNAYLQLIRLGNLEISEKLKTIIQEL